MKVTRLEDADAVARAAADRVAGLAGRRPGASLGLPTGRTPLPLYAELARRHAAGAIDLSSARGLCLDELIVPPSAPHSFRSYMERHVLGLTGLDPSRCEVPNPVAPDLEAECRRYDEAVRSEGLDLALLGIGADGHVAFNLPGPPVDETHVVELPDALADGLGLPAGVRPVRAITVGLGALQEARSVVLLATGAAKAGAVARLAAGRPDPLWPATFLADHPALELLLDPAAASEL